MFNLLGAGKILPKKGGVNWNFAHDIHSDLHSWKARYVAAKKWLT